jgi:transcriptional regulator with XRE-family HTH domain
MRNPVRLLCEEMELNRSDLQRQSGVSYPTLQDLETGGTRSPHPRTLQRIASVLNVDAEQLLIDHLVWRKRKRTSCI